ncbi:MAG: DoxX family membrane protein [Corynebacterium sp.]|nr:DoxX family membrane protein [Corynebacterium sp.]
MSEIAHSTGKRSIQEILLDIISAFARFYMAYIWLDAGISKLGNEMTSAQSIQGYEIFTETWSNYLAQLIAPLEIAGGLLLLFGLFLRHSSWVAAFVLALFMIGIAQAWARGLNIDCGCFEASNEDGIGMDYGRTLVRDAFFMLLTLWTALRPYRRFALYTPR